MAGMTVNAGDIMPNVTISVQVRTGRLFRVRMAIVWLLLRLACIAYPGQMVIDTSNDDEGAGP
jgi:hypothetical protein